MTAAQTTTFFVGGRYVDDIKGAFWYSLAVSLTCDECGEGVAVGDVVRESPSGQIVCGACGLREAEAAIDI